MTPGVYNIVVKQGGRLYLPLSWKDEAGTVVDLTGYSARLSARYRTDSATAVLDASSMGASPAIQLGGSPWSILVDLAIGLDAKPGVYVYDLELKSASGRDYPLLTGRLTIDGSAVKA